MNLIETFERPRFAGLEVWCGSVAPVYHPLLKSLTSSLTAGVPLISGTDSYCLMTGLRTLPDAQVFNLTGSNLCVMVPHASGPKSRNESRGDPRAKGSRTGEIAN